MRSFIVFCLIGVACADNLGYNYSPDGQSGSGVSFGPSGSSGLVGGPLDSAANSPQSYSAPAGVEKEFYTFSADDSEFDDPAAAERLANSLKKNLRVIFIKGPENNGLENAALALAKQAAEQQTAIYVLNKQHDIGDLANKFNAIRGSNNRAPEVHFVKYRTPEDAYNAQNSIQSQYDSLGGPSQSHNGGVAPALNFASRAPAPVQNNYGGSQGNFGAATVPSASYLPAAILRRLRLRL